MDFSEHLDLNDPDGPKLVGHRIWLFDVLYEHIYNHKQAHDLLARFPTLTMAKVYACLFYFELNRRSCLVWVDKELRRQEANHAAARTENRETYRRLIDRMAEHEVGTK